MTKNNTDKLKTKKASLKLDNPSKRIKKKPKKSEANTNITKESANESVKEVHAKVAINPKQKKNGVDGSNGVKKKDIVNNNNVKKKNKKAKQTEGKDGVKTENDPAIEAATVFVGNLPINTKRVQLIRLFKEIGPVKSIRLRTAGGKVLFKHKTRKEAGSLNAYVVFEAAEVAVKALALNGNEFKNNHLRVTAASAKGSNISNEIDAKRMIFVGNLKYTATEEKLREIFTSCGEIAYVRCLQDGEKGCQGVAYVCFKTPEAVGLALELNETILDDRPVHVERYSVKKLGAKNAREAAGAADGTKKKPATGAKKRLDQKNKKKGAGGENETSAQKKKNEYRGVKVDSTKKKTKKRASTEFKQLAKKIAARQ